MTDLTFVCKFYDRVKYPAYYLLHAAIKEEGTDLCSAPDQYLIRMITNWVCSQQCVHCVCIGPCSRMWHVHVRFIRAYFYQDRSCLVEIMILHTAYDLVNFTIFCKHKNSLHCFVLVYSLRKSLNRNLSSRFTKI